MRVKAKGLTRAFCCLRNTLCVLILISSDSYSSDKERMVRFDNEDLSKNSAAILTYVHFIDSYQACMGDYVDPFLSLSLDGVHQKIAKPLLKLQKSLYWRLPRINEFNHTTKLILEWSYKESDRILEIPEGDAELLVKYTKKLVKEIKYIFDFYSASISWGEVDPSIDYFIGSKCATTSLPLENDKLELISKDLSLKDGLIINTSMLLALPLNRLLSTERLVRNDYLSWTAEDLSIIAASKEVCESAKNILRDYSDKKFLNEYLKQSELLCRAVYSDEIKHIAKSYNNFYDVTKGILLESGEINVNRNSTYSSLFKNYQNSTTKNFKLIRNLHIDNFNYKRYLFDIYKKAYLDDNNSLLTISLSNAIDELLTAQAKSKHQYYFPEFKLISWRKDQNNNFEELPFVRNRKIQFSNTLREVDCILDDKLEYLSLEWSKKKSLTSFSNSFQKLEKAKQNLIYNPKLKSQKKLNKAEKKLINTIHKQKKIATKFLLHFEKTGNTEHQKILLRLLSCG